jgi:hypothetical protein
MRRFHQVPGTASIAPLELAAPELARADPAFMAATTVEAIVWTEDFSSTACCAVAPMAGARF